MIAQRQNPAYRLACRIREANLQALRRSAFFAEGCFVFWEKLLQ